MRVLTIASRILFYLVCGCMLFWPQFGDQAFFQLTGAALADGQVYWRDLWDYKQPGIFWFYSISERLGWGVVGVRFLEIALVIISEILVHRLARRWDLAPMIRVVASWVVLTPYVLGTVFEGIGQIEGLLTAVLLGHYVLTQYFDTGPVAQSQAAPPEDISLRGDQIRGLLAGGLAAIVVIFKLLYAPIALVILVACWWQYRNDDRIRPRLQAFLGFWALGLFAVLGTALVAVVALGTAVTAALTSVILPTRVLESGEFDTSTLRYMVVRIGFLYAAGTVLSIPAVMAAITSKRHRREQGVLLWLVTSAVVALPQQITIYRSLILVAPLGVLALLGFQRWHDARWAQLSLRMAVATTVWVVLMVPLLGSSLLPLERAIAKEGFAINDSRVLAIGDDIDDAKPQQLICPVAGKIPPQTAIFVVGDPIVYRTLQAKQATAVHGWAVHMYDQTLWRELHQELTTVKPEWIMIDPEHGQYIDRSAPDIRKFVSANYQALPPCSPDPAAPVWYRANPQLHASTHAAASVAHLRDY